LFDRDADSLSGIFEQAADGSGSAHPVVARDAWEPHAALNGRWLIWSEITQGGADIWMIDMESGQPRPFVNSVFTEVTPIISPNGKWVAYASNESGDMEVYVQPFPQGGARHLVSLAGGLAPLWRSDGTELYYRSGQAVVAVRGAAKEEFRILGRDTLFADFYQGEGFPGSNWDVSPDGESFAMIDARRGTGQITVSVNALQSNR